MAVRHGLIVALLSLAGIAGAVMAPASAAAFTCPETTATGTPVTALSPSDLYSGADDVTASNRLGELMTDLRRSGMKPALIADQLIGAYCPLVAADGTLSEQQKADRVRRFARLVTGLAYVPPNPDEVDVLVQTALTPDLLRQIDEAAGRAGVSRDEWIERAIERQLANP
ncbi:ribbon-helix-helix protein, CopG family [Microvirga sp. 3-52]|uniref:ribbon-helix-helix domain-containing protein n=1 Tax=Microvirga sp. 3-52 TaxID=2792425 RepID=UPI001ACFD11C|nr:CopG family transcriptional regulator [Microvirga sp. 3-52]MBO1909671.1 ribbon-helix-helix protein, CopG family [Microvirga sp. 3-52]MBS7455482.1 ribbon-helix-helix protein, CopG family [Microvirga sp. 3-52]